MSHNGRFVMIGMIVGYIRCLIADQILGAQTDALKVAGQSVCSLIK
jgi:hypothetical protein